MKYFLGILLSCLFSFPSFSQNMDDEGYDEDLDGSQKGKIFIGYGNSENVGSRLTLTFDLFNLNPPPGYFKVGEAVLIFPNKNKSFVLDSNLINLGLPLVELGEEGGSFLGLHFMWKYSGVKDLRNPERNPANNFGSRFMVGPSFSKAIPDPFDTGEDDKISNVQVSYVYVMDNRFLGSNAQNQNQRIGSYKAICGKIRIESPRKFLNLDLIAGFKNQERSSNISVSGQIGKVLIVPIWVSAGFGMEAVENLILNAKRGLSYFYVQGGFNLPRSFP